MSLRRCGSRAPTGRADGDPGCLSLIGRTGRAGVSPADQQHRLPAEHLTNDYRVKTEGRDRTVDQWKLRLDGLDNRWLD